MKYKTLNERQLRIVRKMNHPLFTVEYIEDWINRNPDWFVGLGPRMFHTRVMGFMDAVRCMERNAVSREKRKEG